MTPTDDAYGGLLGGSELPHTGMTLWPMFTLAAMMIVFGVAAVFALRGLH